VSKVLVLRALKAASGDLITHGLNLALKAMRDVCVVLVALWLFTAALWPGIKQLALMCVARWPRTFARESSVSWSGVTPIEADSSIAVTVFTYPRSCEMAAESRV